MKYIIFTSLAVTVYAQSMIIAGMRETNERLCNALIAAMVEIANSPTITL